MSEQPVPYGADYWCPIAHGNVSHCWHTLGVGEERWAGQDVHERLVEEQCCWCGERRWRNLYDQQPGLHGPHAPARPGTRED